MRDSGTSRDLIDALIETLPVAIIVLDAHGQVACANAAARELTGYDLAGLRRVGLAGLVGDAGVGDRDAITTAIAELLPGPGRRVVAAAVPGRRDGTGTDPDVRRIEMRLEVSDRGAAAAWMVATLEDVSAHHLAGTQERPRPTEDRLTGLPNQAAVLDLLRDRLHRAADDVAVVWIALDEASDAGVHDGSIVAAAELLRHVVRARDTVGRIGDDAFAVVCRAREPETPYALGARIAATFRNRDDSGDLPVVVSIGTACGGRDDTPHDLLERAAGVTQAQRAWV